MSFHSQEEISSLLADWAIKEMGFQNSEHKEPIGAPSLTGLDLSGICLGPWVDVWSYIIQHVKSESSVSVVKGNLKLNAKVHIQDSNKSVLLKKRDLLQQEVAELTRSTKGLEDSVLEAKQIVVQKEKDLACHQLVFKEIERKSHILRYLTAQTQDQIKFVNQTTTQLKKYVEKLSLPRGDEALLVDRYRIDVGLMCQQLQKTLDELLQNEPNMEKIQAEKTNVKKKLADLMELLPRADFLQLIQEQQEYDISQWIKILESSVSQNCLPENLDFAPGNVQPLQKLLYELSWFYTESRSRAERASNEATLLKRELEDLQSEIRQHLNTQLPRDDEKIFDSALNLIQNEIQAARRRAITEALRKSLTVLDDSCMKSEANQAEIKEKIAKIESNSKLAEHLSFLMCTLARKHANNPLNILQSAKQLQNIASEEANSVNDRLSCNIVQCNGSLKKEFELFQEVTASNLFTNSFYSKEIVSINHMATHRFSGDAILAPSHVDLALKQMGIHQGVSVYGVFEAIGEKRAKMRNMLQAIKWHETRQFEIMQQYGQAWLEQGSVHFTKLSKSLERKQKSQEADILPSLDKRLKVMEEASELNKEVQTALQEWSDEPAKCIDTGRKVKGQTLDQWRNIWNQSLTQCRKK